MVSAAIGKANIALEKKKQSALTKAVKKVEKRKGKVPKDNVPILRKGVIMLKHIPHGFYEKEMRSYFSQFGKVLRIRVARSKKTGQSRGYAFVEFEFEEVAKIAAEAMNNYLMFERLIKCELVSPDVKPSSLFRDKNIRENNFPKLKARKFARAQENRTLTEEQNEEIKQQRLAKLEEQNKRFAEMGIDYQFPVPERSVKVATKDEEESDEEVMIEDDSESESDLEEMDTFQFPDSTTDKKKTHQHTPVKAKKQSLDGKQRTPEKSKSPHGSKTPKATPEMVNKSGKKSLDGKQKTPEVSSKMSPFVQKTPKTPEMMKKGGKKSFDGKQKTPEVSTKFTSPAAQKTPKTPEMIKKGKKQSLDGKQKTPEVLSKSMSPVVQKTPKTPEMVKKGGKKSFDGKQKTPEASNKLVSPAVQKTPEMTKKEKKKSLDGKQKTPQATNKMSPAEKKTPKATPDKMKMEAQQSLDAKQKTPLKSFKFSPKLLRSRKSQGPQQSLASENTKKTPAKKDKDLPKKSPKLLRSRKSEASGLSVMKSDNKSETMETDSFDSLMSPAVTKTPVDKSKKKKKSLDGKQKTPEKSNKFSPKLLRSRKSQGPAQAQGNISVKNTPAKKDKVSDLPKISPKLLRSRKSDGAGLSPMVGKVATPAKQKKAGRKSVF